MEVRVQCGQEQTEVRSAGRDPERRGPGRTAGETRERRPRSRAPGSRASAVVNTDDQTQRPRATTRGERRQMRPAPVGEASAGR